MIHYYIEITQPLHMVTRNDSGGNGFLISNKEANLHAYYDQLFDDIKATNSVGSFNVTDIGSAVCNMTLADLE